MPGTATHSDTLEAWIVNARRARTWRDRRALREDFTIDLVAEAKELQDEQLDRVVSRLFTHAYDSFEPRPDNIEAGDQQTGFFESDTLISIALGGNGSGKTYVAAMRAIAWLFERQPPPKPNTPFWILGPTMEVTCDVAWAQKLSTLIPPEWVQWDKITWENEKRNFPRAVPLVPWPGRPGKWWTLTFKSMDQGREAMQGAAIGGAWFTEQYPQEIFDEVFRGIREYAFSGSVWAEFTPIDPRHSADMEEIYDRWNACDPTTEDYSFYHLNTEEAAKAGHAQPRWLKSFKATAEAIGMAETKIRGMFASYRGQIYQSFRRQIHLLDFDKDTDGPPLDVVHKRGIDWGSSEEHPFVCIWGYKDSLGTWWIYDEYWNNDQTKLMSEHADAILDRYPWPDDPWHRDTYAPPDRPDLKNTFSNSGIPISSASAGPNSVNKGIDVIKKLLAVSPATKAPRLFIDAKRCPKLARQMTTYRWEQSRDIGLNPKSAKPVPLKKDDDAVDALRYLLYSDYTYSQGGIEGKTYVPPARAGIRHKRGRSR